MKKFVVFLGALALGVFIDAAPQNAARAADPKAKASPTPAPEAAATPAKKPGFLKRVFGGKKEVRQAEPLATPAQAPAKVKAAPQSDTEEKTKTTEKKSEEKTAEETPKERAENKTAMEEKNAKAAPSPKATPELKKETAVEMEKEKPKKSKQKEAKAETKAAPVSEEKEPPSAEAIAKENEAKERGRFQELKTKAMNDDEIAALKQKVDSAPNDEEMLKAEKVFYKALFRKMRAMDGTLRDRIDKMEAAMMRRIDSAAEALQVETVAPPPKPARKKAAD